MNAPAKPPQPNRRVEIVIADVESVASAGSFVGGFELRVEDRSFPEAGWTDFVLPVLPWVCEALLGARHGSVGGAEFMDGPYAIRFENEGDVVRSTGYHRREGMEKRVVFDCRLPWNDWIGALSEACTTAIDGLRAIDAPTSDIDSLKIVMRRLDAC